MFTIYHQVLEGTMFLASKNLMLRYTVREDRPYILKDT